MAKQLYEHMAVGDRSQAASPVGLPQAIESNPCASSLRSPHEIRAIIESESRIFATDEEKFQALVEEWKSNRGPQSSASDLSMAFAYQQIVGMGGAAVPLILAELEERVDHWFWALSAITGADPVPESGQGIMKEMADAWLQWGVKNGYR